MISRSVTRLVALLGTSMPSAGLPGIGAWIRMAAESASARSFCSAVILRTGTPWPGCSSYCVTDGPELTPMTVASTSKLPSVCSISLMFALISSWSLLSHGDRVQQRQIGPDPDPLDLIFAQRRRGLVAARDDRQHGLS